MMVIIKSPPIPTRVYALCFHIGNYIYASEAGALFMHSRNLDKMAKPLVSGSAEDGLQK